MSIATYKTQGGAEKYAAEILARFPKVQAESHLREPKGDRPWAVIVVKPGSADGDFAPPRGPDGPRIP